MDKNEYFKSVCASFLNTHQDEIRKHFFNLNNELEVLVGLHFPKSEKGDFFFSLLITSHLMEIVAVIMSMIPEVREKQIDLICSQLKTAVKFYEKKLEKDSGNDDKKK